MNAPLGELRYLYVGSAEFDRDRRYYRDTLGAELVWEFAHFGARVAAFRLGPGPLILLADHRPAPSCMPIFEVANLTAAERALSTRGWKPDQARFEIPNGPCYTFSDPSGNSYAIFENARPGAMEKAYRDPENRHAVRDKPE